MKKLGLSCIIAVLMIVSFLCGKFFTEIQRTEKQEEEAPRVFIEQLKTKMNISKNRNDIEIFLNGERMTQDIKIDVKR